MRVFFLVPFLSSECTGRRRRGRGEISKNKRRAGDALLSERVGSVATFCVLPSHAHCWRERGEPLYPSQSRWTLPHSHCCTIGVYSSGTKKVVGWGLRWYTTRTRTHAHLPHALGDDIRESDETPAMAKINHRNLCCVGEVWWAKRQNAGMLESVLKF